MYWRDKNIWIAVICKVLLHLFQTYKLNNYGLEIIVSESQNRGTSQSKKCNTFMFLINLFPYLLKNIAFLLDATHVEGYKNK